MSPQSHASFEIYRMKRVVTEDGKDKENFLNHKCAHHVQIIFMSVSNFFVIVGKLFSSAFE